MNTVQPIFDPATHYRIEVQGRVNLDWLQSFDSSAKINGDETSTAVLQQLRYRGVRRSDRGGDDHSGQQIVIQFLEQM